MLPHAPISSIKSLNINIKHSINACNSEYENTGAKAPVN